MSAWLACRVPRYLDKPSVSMVSYLWVQPTLDGLVEPLDAKPMDMEGQLDIDVQIYMDIERDRSHHHCFSRETKLIEVERRAGSGQSRAQ